MSGGEPLETGLSRPSAGDWHPTRAALTTPPKWPCRALVPARQALTETPACADPPEAEIAVASRPMASKTRVTRRPRPLCAPFTCLPPLRSTAQVAAAERET